MTNLENKINEIILKGEDVYNELMVATIDPIRHNTEFLLRLLSENKKTEFGMRYNFGKIDSIEKFKELVPLTNYDNYSGYIERMVQGESNLIAKSSPYGYATTSGSTGTPKRIPVSGDAVDAILCGDYMTYYLQRDLFEIADKNARGLYIISWYDVNELPCGVNDGDIAGMVIDRMRGLFEIAYTTPACSVYANEYHDFYYVHARFALIERNIPSISAAFMTDVFELTNYIIRNQDTLFDDIEKGIISEEINIPARIRDELAARIKPDAERAAELREIFSSGNYGGILKKIWPRLSIIRAIGSAGFMMYTTKVMEYAGGQVKFMHRTYTSSEGQMGLVTELNSTNYCLLPHQMFYEFIRIEDSEDANPPTLNVDQLELDKEYEIVITNLSGFYRYRIMDVVKVTGFINKTPQICFSYRRNQLINMGGEKTSSAHLAAATQKCAEHFGCEITEFAVYPDLRSGTGHYAMLIEAEPPSLKKRAEEVSKVMHEKLCEANPEIGFVMNEGLLGPTEVKFVQPQTFLLYKDLKIMRGASKNQLKPIRVIDTPEKERFFFGLLDNEEYD